MGSRFFVIAIVFALGLGGEAVAQSAAPPVRVRGIVAAADASSLTVTTREGSTAKLAMTADTSVSAVVPLGMDALKPGAFIGTTAVPGPDGKLKAIEVHVFPEAMRGTGEGHRDWDLQPGSSMTNANVDAVVTATNGRQLQLSYKGGNTMVEVPEQTPIVTLAPAERSELKPGVAVFAIVTKGADGTLTANRLTIGRNGIKPPM